MKLIVISSSSGIKNEAEIITELFEAGLETFHLRKNKMSTRRMKELIKKIPSHFHDRIFIHSHHRLAFNFNLKGIHLTSTHKKQRLRTLVTIRFLQIKKPSLSITTSFKTLGELYESKHEYNYDYVFLSPVFNNNSSKFQSGFSEYSLEAALSKTKLKVIARGGVDVKVLDKANKLGFKGVAFYSHLWDSKNIKEEFNKIINKFKQLNIPLE